MKLTWLPEGWADYMTWQDDKQAIRRINNLIKDILRSPYDGIGQPELLKWNLSGCWSRRIDGKNRIIYRVENGAVEIAQCRDHY